MKPRLNYEMVSTEIIRLLTASVDMHYRDIVDLGVLNLACHPATVRNALTQMRDAGLVVSEGKHKFMTYRLSRRGVEECEVRQIVVKAEVKPTINRPRFASGIEAFVHDELRSAA
jgi:hypothetical protein